MRVPKHAYRQFCTSGYRGASRCIVSPYNEPLRVMEGLCPIIVGIKEDKKKQARKRKNDDKAKLKRKENIANEKDDSKRQSSGKVR